LKGAGAMIEQVKGFHI